MKVISSINCLGSSKGKKKKHHLIINLSIGGSALSVLLYAIQDVPLIYSPKDTLCSIHSRVRNVTFAIALFFVYFALWFRIFDVFYKDQVVKKSLSKFVQIVNFSSMPFMIVAGFALLTKALSRSPDKTGNCGCTSARDKPTYIKDWIGIIACTISFQFALLFGFVYPLYLHRKNMLKINCNLKYIIPIIQRVAIASCVCIVSDLINFIFSAVYKAPNNYFRHMFHIGNLMVNLFATTMSFANWREKLYPFGKPLNSPDLSSVEVKQSFTPASVVAVDCIRITSQVPYSNKKIHR